MKKIFWIALFSFLSMSLTYSFTASELDSANRLAWDGIINDKSATPAEYNLDQNVLRQEIAAVARWVSWFAKTSRCSAEFWDVTDTIPNTWACYSIEALLNANLIASNDNFRPEDNITKAEGLWMLVKAACGDDYSYSASNPWTWQEQVVEYASNRKIASSFTDYNTPATRGWVFDVWATARDVCSNDEADIFELLDGLLEDLN